MDVVIINYNQQFRYVIRYLALKQHVLAQIKALAVPLERSVDPTPSRKDCLMGNQLGTRGYFVGNRVRTIDLFIENRLETMDYFKRKQSEQPEW